MDLIDRLTREHREVERLLAQLEESEPGASRDRLIDAITEALRTHMDVEERFLYPIVTDALGREPTDEAINEHDLAREALDNLAALRAEPGFGAAVEMLAAGIGHHVDEEERDVFPGLRREAQPRIDRLDPDACAAAVATGMVDLTRDELYRQAQRAGLPGRSTMTKTELAQALART